MASRLARGYRRNTLRVLCTANRGQSDFRLLREIGRRPLEKASRCPDLAAGYGHIRRI